MTVLALKWVAHSVVTLDLLPGGSNAQAVCSSSDGAIIYGIADDSNGVFHAVRWDGTAITRLFETDPTNSSFVTWCSQDGSKVFGKFGNAISGDPVVWASGGASVTVLAAAGGGNHFAATSAGPIQNSMSDDGSTIALTGAGGTLPSATATKSVSTTTALLPDPSAYFVPTGTDAFCSSPDAGTILGKAAASPGAVGAFWQGSSHNCLTIVGTDPTAVTETTIGSIGDGSAIYGNPLSGNSFYWDTLSTIQAVTGFAGVRHALAQLSGGSGGLAVLYIAHDRSGGSPVAVGSGHNSTPSAVGIRWTGTVAQELTLPPGQTSCAASCCSGTGSTAGGTCGDGSGATYPCYWGADGVGHLLPIVGPTLSSTFVVGVSRDGAVFFGYGDGPTAPPAIIVATADLFFTVTAGFADPGAVGTRRKFISITGGAQNLGPDGSNPFGVAPPIFLSSNGTPSTFAHNNGRGGPFSLSSGALTASATNPPPSASTSTTTLPTSSGQGVLGDYRNGNLYAFNPATYTDNGTPRKWLRRWRALPAGQFAAVKFSWLAIDMQTGGGVPDGANPQLVLRWSDDGGHTFSGNRIVPVGQRGETAFTVKFNRLGMTRRFSGSDRIFELSSTDPFRVAILDADVEVE